MSTFSQLGWVDFSSDDRERVKQVLSQLQEKGTLKVSGSGTRNRRHWYLLAPILLDQQNHAGWVEQWVDGQLKAQHASGFNARLKEIKNKLNAEDNALGEMPEDLASYLAWLSIGSPAVCAYRALNSVKTDQAYQHLQDASTIAFSFVALFNSVSGTGVIQRFSKQNKIPSDWKSIVRYCAQGGLQAVLDEYVYSYRREAVLIKQYR
ncbi:MAG: hypothetical protein WAW61_05975 [Methylococcaceae bacterium]